MTEPTTPATPLSITLRCPEGWDEVEGAEGTDVAFFAPAVELGEFRANVTLVVTSLERPTTAEEVLPLHGEGLAAAFEGARILDASPDSVDGRRASHVLITYPHDGEDLTLEQWIVPIGARSVALSGTCLSGDYPDVADDFAEVAAGALLDA